MLSRLSGSKLELAAHCLYWAREDVPLPTAQEASAAMALGNATHTAAEEDTDLALQDAFLAATTEANIDAVAERFKLTDAATDKLRDLYGQWVSWWEVFSQGKPWRPEVPYAWNVVTRTARELPKGEHRDYSMVDRRVEIPCTVDVTLAETGRVQSWTTDGPQ